MNLLEIMPELEKPFAAHDIDFLPKNNFEQDGKVVCLSLPFADKRVYEDRLNAVCPGEWTTQAQITIAASKVIAVVTVTVCGIVHTDVGEAPLSDDNAATEAYAQAFKRACSQFKLGRYLYELEKQYIPWDRAKKRFAVSPVQKLTIVKAMYRAAGLMPTRNQAPAPKPEQVPAPAPEPTLDSPVTAAQLEEIKQHCIRLRRKVKTPQTYGQAQALLEEFKPAS